MNKKSIIIVSSIIILIVMIVLLGICFNNKEVRKIGDITIYKKINYSSFEREKVNLTSTEERKIKNYLGKESLKERKDILKCMVIGKYTIAFDDFEIYFDDDSCVTYLYNKKEDNNIQINISSKLKKYIINIVNEGEK